ncbi:MAG TPA: hypothetical protein VF519_00215 [Mycobacteriales bacterium]|jgi:hypothetical protein
MKRLLAAAFLATVAAAVPASAGPAVPQPGGQCEDPVDFVCRTHVCGPDELDCGMIPPCFVWVSGACRL